jgi:1-acyl-sn-glycerol-3-phosphate acyltransferase
MLNNNQAPASDESLIQLRGMLEKNQEMVFGRIKSLFQISDQNNNIDKFVELINAGFVPVIYANHQSHADGVIISIVIEKLRQKLPDGKLNGFLCPVAASMASGDQHNIVQGATFLFEPIFKKLGFIYVPIIREDDRRKYGMSGSNTNSIEKLLHAPANNYGMAVFPEGTVQGGRLMDSGKIFGMQEVEGGGIFLRCVKFWQTQGRKSVLLPVGIVNSYKTFNPDNYDLPKAMIEMLAGNSEVVKLVDAAVGEPKTVDDLSTELENELDAKSKEHIDLLMKKIAKLLPNEAKGYYRV